MTTFDSTSRYRTGTSAPSTDWWMAWVGGSVAAYLTHPLGWVASTPGGWGVISALVERGARP
jgi:hypothetical protein